jgi:hypothetical protein
MADLPKRIVYCVVLRAQILLSAAGASVSPPTCSFPFFAPPIALDVCSQHSKSSVGDDKLLLLLRDRELLVGDYIVEFPHRILQLYNASALMCHVLPQHANLAPHCKQVALVSLVFTVVPLSPALLR